MRRMMTGIWLAAVLLAPLGCGGKPDSDAKAPGAGPAPKADGGAAKPGQDDSGKQAAGTKETAPDAGKANSLDLAYVTPDFFAAAVVFPQRIVSSPALKGLPVDGLLEKVEETIGVNPRELEQAIVLVEPPQDGLPPEPSAVLRFVKPVRAKEVLDRAWSKRGQAAEETTHEGKPYFRGPAGMAAWAPDERTLVVSSEATLKKMVAATKGDGPLVDRLRAGDAQADLIVAVVMEPARQAAQQMAETAKRGAPPPVRQALAAGDDLAAATLSLRLDARVTLTALLEGKDTHAAGRVESLAEGLLALGRGSSRRTGRRSSRKGTRSSRSRLSRSAKTCLARPRCTATARESPSS